MDTQTEADQDIAAGIAAGFDPVAHSEAIWRMMGAGVSRRGTRRSEMTAALAALYGMGWRPPATDHV